MNDNEKLVTAYKCGTNVEATMIRDLLESAGIPYMLTNETFSSIYPIGHNSIGEIQVLVFERDVENVQKLLASNKTTE